MIVELTGYQLPAALNGMRPGLLTIAIGQGEFWTVASDTIDQGLLFLRALATLEAPVAGVFRFEGETLDFSDYRRLLPYKRRIGYVTSDTAFFSNRTIRENLLLMRSYFENTPGIRLDDWTLGLCRDLGIANKLDLRPGQIDPLDLYAAVVVRELRKGPRLFLVERPEDFMRQRALALLVEHVDRMQKQGTAVVVVTDNENLTGQRAHRLIIHNDSVKEAG
jgi:ABC-type lipoprotein export system ATPase subunit